MATDTPRSIRVECVPRIEGEAALDVVVAGQEVTHLRLKIFDPPRFLRTFLIGRRYDEVPELVSRICGICPTSHQITALQALEAAMCVPVSPQTVALRRLLGLAQWIQSHAIHIYLLAAPDLMGYESAIALASAYPEVVQRALRLKKLGMELTRAIGGRKMNAPTACLGGFTRLPEEAALERLRGRLERARSDATDTLALVSGLALPTLVRDNEYVSLRHPDRYPVNAGRVVSTSGLDISPGDYDTHVEERPLNGSARWQIAGRGAFAVGPLARLNLNRDRLCPAAAQALQSCGLALPSHNPFSSILARAIELVQAVDDSIHLIDQLDLVEEENPVHIAAGAGAAATEAPRGTLYHRYEVDGDGVVQAAAIVAPTAYNVSSMEEDLRMLVPQVLDLPEPLLRTRLEMLVRSYDPCLSCSCHFLAVRLRNSH